MSDEVFRWIAGVGIPVLIGWAVAVSWALNMASVNRRAVSTCALEIREGLALLDDKIDKYMIVLEKEFTIVKHDLENVKRQSELLVKMHNNADDYGFGTKATNEIIRNNTAMMDQISRYLKFDIEHRVGLVIPPELPTGNGNGA